MWHALLLFGSLALAAEPEPWEPPTPCEWDPATCPDVGVPARPLRPMRYVTAVADGIFVNLWWHFITAEIAGLEWSQVSGDSIATNFETGWVWDGDRFSTNQIAHPYHGAMFMGGARVNGLTYYEALPVVAFSSWQWEQLLETEAPSINDQITTTFAGLYFGELMWRISGLLLDESTSGAPRLGRELGAAVVDPFRGFDRFLMGKAWKRGRMRAPYPVAGEVGAGMEVDGLPEVSSYRIRLHGEMNYGDPFRRRTLRRPLDVFDLRVDLFATPSFSERGAHIFSTGGIVGRHVPLGAGGDGFVALFQSYDYAEDPMFKVGGTSLGPGWWSRHRLGPHEHLALKVTVLGTILGAADSPYVKDEIERNYIFGPGAALHARMEVRSDRLGYVFVETRRFWVHSASAPHGDELVGLSRAGITADVYKGWGLGADAFWYERDRFYADHPDLHEEQLRLQVHAIKVW